jgi:hypothetical protein
MLERTWDSNGNPVVAAPADQSTACATALANLTAHREGVNASAMAMLVNQRLGNLRDTGKFAIR